MRLMFDELMLNVYQAEMRWHVINFYQLSRSLGDICIQEKACFEHKSIKLYYK